MTRIRRNDSPSQLNAAGRGGNHRENCGGRARLERMLAPPGISFRDPKRIEPGGFTRLRHGDRLLYWLHAELQNTDIEWNWHDFSFRLLVPNCWFHVLRFAAVFLIRLIG